MRNLKKVLALVLSLVMALSMVTIASAAVPGTSFTDDAAITEFDEAIQVLEALRVFQGRENTDGTFSLDPNAEITRAEAAAVVYRAITGDVTDADVAMFADEFSDVKLSHWAAGYIGYCVNHGIMKGFEDGTFRPDEKVTGYQVMAMVLRSIGYNSYNEFTGADWQAETAQYWNLAGITNSVNQAALRKNAPRALVAEIVFRAISEASTVKYNALYKYENTNMTKGYEIFGLYGGERTVGVLEAPAKVPEAGGVAAYYTEASLAVMGNRAAAVADTDASLTVAEQIAYRKYGDPIAFWYLDTNKAVDPGTTAMDGVDSAGVDALDRRIAVRFDPIKTYTTAVADETIFADGGFTGIQGTVVWSEDGSVAQTQDVYRLATEPTTLNYTFGGKGTVTELYRVDGIRFLAIKNTYVAKVGTTYLANAAGEDRAMTLVDNAAADVATAPTIDYGVMDPAAFGTMAGWSGLNSDAYEDDAAKMAGLTAGTVVRFNKYNDGALVDHETIKVPNIKNVTVTWTYDVSNGDGITIDTATLTDGLNNTANASATSWFRATEGTFEYNRGFAGNHLGTAILNRDFTSFTLAGAPNAQGYFKPAQTLYLDDYGYVLYAHDAIAAGSTGYAVLTRAEFNNYQADNGYYLNFTGFKADGTAFTGKGAIDRTVDLVTEYTYGSTAAADASASLFDAGIYSYTYNAATDLYSMVRIPTAGTGGTGATDDGFAIDADPVDGAGNSVGIQAGDPDAFATDRNGDTEAVHVLNDDTVFVIAEYNAYGFISGYKVVTNGFKNIPDLIPYTAPEMASWVATNNTVPAVDFADTSAIGTAVALRTIDLVYVEGMKQVADSVGAAIPDNVFYLLDHVPQDKVVEYDVHKVIKNGSVTEDKFAVNFVNDAGVLQTDYVGGYDGIDSTTVSGGGSSRFWRVESRGGADQWITRVNEAAAGMTYDTTDLDYWAPGVLRADGTDYITMASNCVVYQIRTAAGTCTALTAAQVAGLLDDTALVAGWNEYGFATVIYIVD